MQAWVWDVHPRSRPRWTSASTSLGGSGCAPVDDWERQARAHRVQYTPEPEKKCAGILFFGLFSVWGKLSNSSRFGGYDDESDDLASRPWWFVFDQHKHSH